MKKPSKSHLLLEWIRRHKLVSSAMVRQWGLDNYYISSDRVVRKMVENKVLIRVRDQEIRNMGLSTKMAWYEPFQY